MCKRVCDIAKGDDAGEVFSCVDRGIFELYINPNVGLHVVGRV